MRKILAALALVMGVASAQNTVILVRHAERASARMSDKDLGLSAAGKKRAEELARVLGDAGIQAIYTSDAPRTIQTAEPLARRLKLTPREMNDPNAIVKDIEAHSDRTVLVVHHSNTLPKILEGLGVKNAPAIGESQYDWLFVVSIDMHGDAKLLPLHYGN
jgi:broad specificity phosphatase PhoE